MSALTNILDQLETDSRNITQTNVLGARGDQRLHIINKLLVLIAKELEQIKINTQP